MKNGYKHEQTAARSRVVGHDNHDHHNGGWTRPTNQVWPSGGLSVLVSAHPVRAPVEGTCLDSGRQLAGGLVANRPEILTTAITARVDR